MEKIHLLITRRGPVWRVRILLPDEPRPRWRAYRVADYPRRRPWPGGAWRG